MTASKNQNFQTLSRREAIKRVSAMFGGVALVGQASMLAACSDETAHKGSPPVATGGLPFSPQDIALLGEIAETILPETDTPGAKAAGVGPFMAMMVMDTYYPSDQEIFVTGLATLNARCEASYGQDFLTAEPGDRLQLLTALDGEQFEYMQGKHHEAPTHFFRMMKELALLGYFTSEVGYTQAMRYVETPGRYDPCVPHQAGDKIWANHA